jgi:hypothetical protein
VPHVTVHQMLWPRLTRPHDPVSHAPGPACSHPNISIAHVRQARLGWGYSRACIS